MKQEKAKKTPRKPKVKELGIGFKSGMAILNGGDIPNSLLMAFAHHRIDELEARIEKLEKKGK